MNLLIEYEKIKIKKAILLNNLERISAILESETKRMENLSNARLLIAEVSRVSQEELKEQIEELVTSCLQSVFQDRDFQFRLNFQIKRNKMECVPSVIDNGVELNPEHEMGGGVLDIISFALRIIFWNLKNPRTRPILMLDEPLRFCGNLIVNACEMIKRISDGLGTQVLIITHSDELMEIADKSWTVKHILGKSVLTQDTR